MRLPGLHGMLPLIFAGSLPAQAPPPPSPAIVLLHANLIDGEAAQPVRDVSVFIRDGKIERILSGPISTTPGVTVFDLKGRWVLPGLIDAHAHLNSFAAARAALESGATTVRSLGVDHFRDLGFRELSRWGIADLPDVLGAGYHVRPQPAEALFLDLPQLADLMSGVNGPQNVRRMVAALIDRGADVIKIMATERAGLPQTDPRKRVYTDAELAAAVDEAGKRGIGVAAHAHGDEGAAAAVRAGVRTIEHGTWLSESTFALMKTRGTCFVPTVATILDLLDVGGDYDNAALMVRGRAMLPHIRSAVQTARRLGVRVIPGTDTQYGPQSSRRVQDELIELGHAGASPMELIKAATSVAAQCLGISQRTGAVKAGLEADLLVVDQDPLADPEALRQVVLVVNNGRVALNRLPN